MDVPDTSMLLQKKKAAAAVRVHLENNPRASTVYHITPELFGAAMQKRPALAKRIQCSIGCDPAQLGMPLQEAEVLFIHGRLDVIDLAARAPYLKWVKSTGAGRRQAATLR